MPIILGVHNGHHSSCAIVKDGILISAIEQERVTCIKGDGANYLSNNLPIEKCLKNAGLSLNQIDLIVSSFQAIGPGGVGLIQPIFDYDFNIFDPFDKRHFVISHHYAHALSAYGTSGFKECAVLVCDLAGSTSVDGKDFIFSFSDFYNYWTNFRSKKPTKTECYSIYQANGKKINLLRRKFCIPHCSPEIFVCSPASLYDNIARFIFNKEDAHGELMALASLADNTNQSCTDIKTEDIIECFKNGEVAFKNNWQHKIQPKTNVLDYVTLAAVVQNTLEIVLLKYAHKAKKLTKSKNLATAGGVFLNIKANSVIHSSKLFSEYHVPSSPHDAGIAIGCAYYGWHTISNKIGVPTIVSNKKASDRIGSRFERKEIEQTLNKYSHLCTYECHISPNEIARLIVDGNIIARFSGAAEFGPRALGGRSLLATPLLEISKHKLNIIKGRQEWRPVAPIITKDSINNFFDGVGDSPYMNQLHVVKPKYRMYLNALSHPDNSVRAQTLTKEDDNQLYQVLIRLQDLTGYPIIVNTSFNGKGKPIVETLEKCFDFFLENQLIDYLIIEDFLVKKLNNPLWHNCKLAPDCIISIINHDSNFRHILLRNGKSMEVSNITFNLMKTLPKTILNSMDEQTLSEMEKSAFLQFLIKDS